MGKLSNILLKSLLFGAVKAQNDTFAVTNCNPDGALTFRISQAYFENNLAGQTNDFNPPEDGYYSRTIPQNELELSFDNETDDIVLSYTILTESPTHQANANTGISFADESVQFQCRYPRTVDTGSQMTLAPPPPQPVIGTGNFIYTMDIQVGPHGGDTIVNINANHNIDGIVPRITKCRIHMGEQEIYAAHSFEGDVCFDNSILNMNQRSFGKDIEFSFRTFRFTGGNQTSDDQEQTISCELHLEPAADVPHEQASGCTCSDVEDCAGPFEYVEDPTSVCWGMCNEQGGQCSGCMGADPDATAGYCCSGVNHHGGGGPAANGDCPADAIAAVSTDVHSCVVKKKVREYVQLANSVCWGECNERGGECTTCKNHDPNATVGYCCSGANHHGGDGAVNNEDCPVDAVAAITTDVHSCVVHKQKEMEWVELPNSICWGECNGQGGECLACKSHHPDAFAGYCCSGVNHHGGGGAVENGDCPANAIAAVTQSTHACVVLKEKTPQEGSNHLH